MKKIAVDTSVIIAIITNEALKEKLISATRECELFAPAALHWEIGNAFSAMMKRGRISFSSSLIALKAYQKIPLNFVSIDLEGTLRLVEQLNLYAYDAYFLACAKKHRIELLSLDKSLLKNALDVGIKIIEVE